MRPLFLLPLLLLSTPAWACNNFVASPGATADGSTLVTYTCDGEFHPTLRIIPAADHAPGDLQEIVHWNGKKLGDVAYPEHTWRVVNLMNEHQVSVAETTTGGREELIDPDGVLHYWQLMRLSLQRATTARECVETMGRLAGEYGYRSSGESYCIGDPEEAWIMEMVGPGPGGDGAHWVAIRVPDGMVGAFANLGRIGEIPSDGGKDCLHSDLDAMRDFARENGWWDGENDFVWRDAFHPATAQQRRYTATRVWSLFRRAAPSQEFDTAYHRGDPDAEAYPLFVKPDAKLSLADVMELMRDHYEGTAYDMTTGAAAGPHGYPVRYRPMGWEVDGEHHTWERPISTHQTGFSMVCQSRGWLPDPVGGVTWYGLDDTDFTCYTPLYCAMDRVPVSYATGSLGRFDWDSAWWVFNFASNYAGLRYDAMIQDVRALQAELEGEAMDLQPAVEATAASLHESDPDLMRRYLTDYSVGRAELVVDRWRELAEGLVTRYNDGYVKDENGRPREQGYPEAWLRTVRELDPERYRLPEDDQAQPAEPEDY